MTEDMFKNIIQSQVTYSNIITANQITETGNSATL